MRKFAFPDVVAVTLMTVAVTAFFFRLFFPMPQLIVTPDFGRNDALSNFSNKFALSSFLKQGKLPFWISEWGGGFPAFASGGIGALFLPNLFLFFFFPPVLAYALALFFAVTTVGWGTYVLLRSLRTGSVASLFGALTFSFSGVVVTQMTHLGLLQGFSVLPWLTAVTIRLIQSRSLRWIGIFALLASQQVFAGFPQASFISILVVLTLSLWLIRAQQNRLIPTFRLFTALILTFGVSAIQLLPAWEYQQTLSVAGGFQPETATYFSYPLAHLKTLVDPFALGNPKLGTYPAFQRFDGSIFWENVGGIGLLPIVFFFIFIITRVHAYYTRRVELYLHIFFLLTVLASFLLMLGKYSPLYIVFSFPPFSWFRVPSRFVWPATMALIVLAASGFHVLWRIARRSTIGRAALIAILFAQAITLFRTWSPYHALASPASFLTPPAILNDIFPIQRLISVGGEIRHNAIFLKHGWQETEGYIALNNVLSSDRTLLWGVPHLSVDAGRQLRRSQILETLLANELTNDASAATVSGLGNKMLDILGVDTVVSALLLTHEKLLPITTVREEPFTFTAYRNPTAPPLVYQPTRSRVVTTEEEAVRNFQDPSFVPGQDVLIEQPLAFVLPDKPGTVKVINRENGLFEINLSDTPTPTLVVIAETYYPGWRATVDGKPTEIIPVNIRHMGVLVPKDGRKIFFRFTPTSFPIGPIVTGVATLISVVIAVFPIVFSVLRTRQIASLQLPRRPGNPGR